MDLGVVTRNEHGASSLLIALALFSALSLLIYLGVESHLNDSRQANLAATIELKKETLQNIESVLSIPQAIYNSYLDTTANVGLGWVLSGGGHDCLNSGTPTNCPALSTVAPYPQPQTPPADSTSIWRGASFNLYRPDAVVPPSPSTATALAGAPTPASVGAPNFGVPGYSISSANTGASGDRCDLTNTTLRNCVLQALVTVERVNCNFAVPCVPPVVLIFRVKVRYSPVAANLNTSQRANYLSVINDKDPNAGLSPDQIKNGETFKYCYAVAHNPPAFSDLSPAQCPY